jgi:hypothetical protein
LLADLPNFCQNLMFSHCSNCNIHDFHCLQTTYPSQQWLSFWNTACTQLLLARTREEWTWHHLVAPHICCSA